MEFSLVSEDHTIDLSDAFLSALVMETPFVVLCREDCRGLCPVCGANLNEEDCGHAAQREQEAHGRQPLCRSPASTSTRRMMARTRNGELPMRCISLQGVL